MEKISVLYDHSKHLLRAKKLLSEIEIATLIADRKFTEAATRCRIAADCLQQAARSIDALARIKGDVDGYPR